MYPLKIKVKQLFSIFNCKSCDDNYCDTRYCNLVCLSVCLSVCHTCALC